MVEQRLRECYMVCHAWCTKAGMTIEPDKMEVMFFTRSRPNPSLQGTRPPTIYLPQWELNSYYAVSASDHVRYLGLHLDHRLSWNNHVTVMAMRTKGTLKSLQLLGNSVHSLNHSSWHLAYNTICIPTLTYGSPIWFRGQKKHIKVLQAVQNMAICVIMGAFRSMPLEPLHQLTAIPPIQLHLEWLSMQAAIQLLTLPTSSPVLHRLGPPWSSAEGSGVLLSYPTQTRQPDTCIQRLCRCIPAESRTPMQLDRPPWELWNPPPNQLTTVHNPCKGKECK
jgi:hypothetical protein